MAGDVQTNDSAARASTPVRYFSEARRYSPQRPSRANSLNRVSPACVLKQGPSPWMDIRRSSVEENFDWHVSHETPAEFDAKEIARELRLTGLSQNRGLLRDRIACTGLIRIVHAIHRGSRR